ncbi:serine carboxypeptidase [Mycena rebaudengoi]|nr:serine carboxypeptidase [Mycena rebaudengoi]
MCLRWLGVLLSLTSALAVKGPGQIPAVDGVVGGVRKHTATKITPLLRPFTTMPGKLRAVENSGICETTPTVYQASGYGDLTANQSIWFWYFDSRKNAATAPLSLWFNGGPIGTGFSHGPETVGTSQQAAADVWKFLQIFLSDRRFSHLAKNGLGLWTESYGGHYGPVFAAYFLSQNAAIAAGKVNGIQLNLQALGIGNGMTDALLQYPAYMTYAAANPYGPLVSPDIIASTNASFNQPITGCKARSRACNNRGSDAVCSAAQDVCNTDIMGPPYGEHDPNYVLAGPDDTYPPDIEPYLASGKDAIGADLDWKLIATPCDWMRTTLPAMDLVANSGVKLFIYNGDAVLRVHSEPLIETISQVLLGLHRELPGVENILRAMKNQYSTEFQRQAFSTYTVAGHPAGLYKNAGRFSYLRVFGAGHEVPAYKAPGLEVGQAALQFFS